MTISGNATDAGGGTVAAVEVTLDGGASWHPAAGRNSFTYTGVLAGTGSSAIQVRAIDDSANIQSPATTLPAAVNCPCSIFGSTVPGTPAAADTGAVTLGMKFTSSANGFLTGLRFYKGAGNTGTHTGTLYRGDGTVLSTVTFTNETATGWQSASFASAVPVTAGTTYVAAYVAPAGRYSADSQYFAYGGHTAGVLTALGGTANPNGVYGTGPGLPGSSYQQTNYYVDVLYSETDTAPLSVTSSTPTTGSTSVPVTSTVTATFSRDPQPSSISLAVNDSANSSVPGSVTYDAALRTVTFTPTGPLTAGTTYTARLTASADGVGPMPSPAVWTFTTVQPDSTPGVCSCRLFNDSDAPSVAAATDPNSVELGVAFSADTDGQLTGVRFYKGPGNTGAHTVTLWTATGTQLATAAVTAESTVGWQTASFATPVAVTAGTTYIASYRAPAGRYSYTLNGLGGPRDRSPLHTSVNAGRYTYGGAAPLSTSQANYYVDPVFTVAPGAAPQVTAITPGDRSTSVPVTSAIQVTFGTSIQPGTAVITVTDNNGVAVAGSQGAEPLGSKASFTPSVSLSAGTAYTVTVTGAKNLGGTPMSTPVTSSFTTSGAAACPCSLLSSSATPPIPDSGDGSAITVGLQFTANVDGFITGLRYYRDAANTGTHTGAFYTQGGTRLATLTFPTSAPGWQTATFTSPVPITAGTTYVASAFMPAGRYSVAPNFFATPVVNSPLTGTLGTYAYGNESFPTSSWNNSYYYIDVAFTTQDNAPPAISSTTPDGTTLVQPDTAVSATFGRGISTGSLQMTLTDAGNVPVPGTVKYDPVTMTAVFQPTAPLALGSTFTASVQANSAAGIAMPAPTVWQFTTVAPPPTGAPYSLFLDTDIPATPAWADNGPISVGIKFSSNQSGSVTTVKFYAGPGNNGPYNVDIWAADGTKLGTGRAFGNASGWKTVLLDAPVAITAGNTYVASYRGASGHYAVTSNGLSAGQISGPLQIPPGGGVYSHPNAFSTATTTVNFFVDVVVVLPPSPTTGTAAPITPASTTPTTTTPTSSSTAASTAPTTTTPTSSSTATSTAPTTTTPTSSPTPTTPASP